MERILHKRNIDSAIKEYELSLAEIGKLDPNLIGIKLFQHLKRNTIDHGPYPHVTIFEAANRIMTDMVILKGVKWLLDNNTFPFKKYHVEYGNEDKNAHDIMSINRKKYLIGEAFNVAQSFFQTKKNTSLKKLRNSNVTSDYKIIIANRDAIKENYVPQVIKDEYFLFVDVESGDGRLHSTASK